MHIEVILEVAIALFAVYGVFCAIQLLSEHLFPSSSFTLAVFADDKEDVKDIYNKICYAQVICARERGAASCPILILDSESELDPARLCEFERMDVEIYRADKI